MNPTTPRRAVCRSCSALPAAGRADAQVTPAAGYTPPDDTPSIKIGAVIFADYTYQQKPTAKDAAGNEINPNSFNVTRAYINVTGNISHLVGVPRDARRRRAQSLPGTSLDGSVTYRLKYAYAQFNLDDWLPKGSLRAPRDAADAVHRQHRGHLPLPLPGHPVHRARRLHVVGRPRRDRSARRSRTTTATSTSASTTARATRRPRSTTRRP